MLPKVSASSDPCRSPDSAVGWSANTAAPSPPAMPLRAKMNSSNGRLMTWETRSMNRLRVNSARQGVRRRLWRARSYWRLYEIECKIVLPGKHREDGVFSKGHFVTLCGRSSSVPAFSTKINVGRVPHSTAQSQPCRSTAHASAPARPETTKVILSRVLLFCAPGERDSVRR